MIYKVFVGERFYSVGLFAASSGKSASVLEAPPPC